VDPLALKRGIALLLKQFGMPNDDNDNPPMWWYLLEHYHSCDNTSIISNNNTVHLYGSKFRLPIITVIGHRV
jgi:hypothetical protein